MPVPPGLLMDIAILVVREYWRSRKRRTAPAAARTPAPSRAPIRRLSPVGRVVRLAVIAGVLWLIWREVARRRAALIERRRIAFSQPLLSTASPTPPPLPSAPVAPPAAPPPLAEPSPASGEATPSVPPVDAEQTASANASDSPTAEHAAPEDSPDGEETSNGALIGRCARCRARQPMQQVTFEVNASGRSIARGTCPVCGAGIARFVAREQAERGSVER